jgi:hypothetical protein
LDVLGGEAIEPPGIRRYKAKYHRSDHERSSYNRECRPIELERRRVKRAAHLTK